MKARALRLSPEAARAIAVAAACVPAPARRAFLKRTVTTLRPYGRPDDNLVATVVVTGLRLAGVLPHAESKHRPLVQRRRAA